MQMNTAYEDLAVMHVESCHQRTEGCVPKACDRIAPHLGERNIALFEQAVCFAVYDNRLVFLFHFLAICLKYIVRANTLDIRWNFFCKLLQKYKIVLAAFQSLLQEFF